MSGEEYRTLIDPEFAWVIGPDFPTLEGRQAESLEKTLAVARKELADAVRAVPAQLNGSGSHTNPEVLADAIHDVRMWLKIVSEIAGLQVAVSGCGKS